MKTCACLLLAFMLAVPIALADANADLERLREIYNENLDTILTANETRLKAFQDQYAAALVSLQEKMQKAGQLEPLLAVKQERERFANEKTLNAGSLSSEPNLRALQQSYLASFEQIGPERHRQILDLAEKYDRSLGSLQTSLTQKGELEAAIAAKNERAALQERPEITLARTAVAAAEKNKPAVPEPPPAAVQPKAPPQPEPKTSTARKYAGSDSNRVNKRYKDLADAILEQDWATATTYVDPAYVQKNGTQAVRVQFRMIFPFIQMVDERQGMKLGSGSVTIADDGQSASLTPKVWFRNDWRELRSQTWILTEGDWYLKLGGGNAAMANTQDFQPQKTETHTTTRKPPMRRLPKRGLGRRR